MFLKTNRYYDAIYNTKDYEVEAVRLIKVISEKARLGKTCGHTARRCMRYRYAPGPPEIYLQVEGLDLDEEMLALARERLPGVPLHLGSMSSFDLGKHYDVVTCLSSAIAAMVTVEELQQAVRCMARHTTPGGLVLIDPWLHPRGVPHRQVGRALRGPA